MPTYNKDNEPIDPKTNKPLKVKKHSNIPAYLIAGLITILLLAGGVMFASEKLADYLTTEFSYQVVNLK